MDDHMAAEEDTEPVRPDWLSNPDIIIFAGEEELPVGAVEYHGMGDWFANRFGRSKEDVKADWAKVQHQIAFLLDGVGAAARGYEMDEITFELGFSAEGQIVFVAKAGITTTISATFRRKVPPPQPS